MRFAAVCCSVLQCVAAYCSALQCVAVCCSVLQCVAACCSVFQYIVVDMYLAPTATTAASVPRKIFLRQNIHIHWRYMFMWIIHWRFSRGISLYLQCIINIGKYTLYIGDTCLERFSQGSFMENVGLSWRHLSISPMYNQHREIYTIH